MKSLPRLVAAAALAASAAAMPADACRVFLDHDLDGDLTTFRNVVEGSPTAPITITVVLGPEDAGREDLPFALSWDCHHEGWNGVAHGDVAWVVPMPASPPFTDPAMNACTGFGCDCVATRVLDSPVEGPWTEGSYAFAVVPFSRDAAYDQVTFQVDCGQCSYLPGDEAATRMTFTTLIGVEPAGWGRAKAAYR
jgi:hypothetical protein